VARDEHSHEARLRLGPGGGVPQLAGVLLAALAEDDLSIDAFIAVGDDPTTDGALDHPNIKTVAELIRRAGASREHRSPLTRFLSGQRPASGSGPIQATLTAPGPAGGAGRIHEPSVYGAQRARNGTSIGNYRHGPA